MEIRKACTEDAKDILKIYSPYVENTAVSFEYDVPSLTEFKARIKNTLEKYPYYVATEQGKIIGYAYAGAYRTRKAYQHCAEASIYIDEKYHLKGVGKKLYEKLEETLKLQGITTLYACITFCERKNDEYLSDGSIHFHEKAGYKLVGKFNGCGYKFSRWYGVIWMEKKLSDDTFPEKFIPFSHLNLQ